VVRVSILLSFILFSYSFTDAQSDSTRKYWVFFKNRGTLITDDNVWRRAAERISTRAIHRRAKHLKTSPLIQKEDLPVFQPYIEEIIRRGGILHQQSRWLNAASFFLPPDLKHDIENLSFVNEVQPVRTFYRRDEYSVSDLLLQRSTADTIDYGPSFAQNDMISATKVHQLGITGEGVIVGMLDTGFRWRVHEALQNARVIAEWDFIQNDDTTANQQGDRADQDAHGTSTMSVVGGYMAGKLIGPAFGVQFLLAKTEDNRSETRIEEDNWVAGIEWMEARGVDVVSSSLGYDIFDDGTGYRWENGDFNGRTAVTSRAAIRAAQLGVVVCTAMGNKGNGNGTRGTMLAPADADSILSVGAINFSRRLAGFSSTGPTNDGRTKPEVVAPGVSVYHALPGQSTYGVSQGTSLATPLTAATAALVLSARPELTAMQVRDAIRYTSDTIATGDPRVPGFPNNFVGWGLVNVYKALSYPTVEYINPASRISAFLGSPGGIYLDSVAMLFSTDTSIIQSASMVRIAGPVNRSNGTFQGQLNNIPLGSLVHFYIQAVESSGVRIRVPQDTSLYFSFVVGRNFILPPKYSFPSTFALLQNYPNPFNSVTTISVNSPNTLDGTLIDGALVIYNLLGQKVKTLYTGFFLPGPNTFQWDGTSDNGNSVASGIYLYTLRSATFSEVKKMILLR
jgi:serine protease AprX